MPISKERRAEILAKARAAKADKQKSVSRGSSMLPATSTRCPYCRTICDAKPFIPHILGHRHTALPASPPPPPIYDSDKGLSMASVLDLSDKERAEIYLNDFEKGGHKWEDSVRFAAAVFRRAK